jgi:hypothetical protein
MPAPIHFVAAVRFLARGTGASRRVIEVQGTAPLPDMDPDVIAYFRAIRSLWRDDFSSKASRAVSG